MSIFVLPDQEAFDSAQKKREQLAGVFQEKFGHLIKERTVFDGDVGYWFKKFSPLNTWEPAIVERRMLSKKLIYY